MPDEGGWSRMGWQSWSVLDEVRARLAAGADPNAKARLGAPALHEAAEWGSADVVAELARLVDDVDAEHDGRTALWVSVHASKPDNARVLSAAGADPWRPMMAGWSPGRLSLASRSPDLFPAPPGVGQLLAAESIAVAEAHRLIDALGDFRYEGLSLACTSGIDAAEAVRRLEAAVIDDDAPQTMAERMWRDPMRDDALLTVGITDVPGGCVISQAWAFGASTPEVARRLSIGGLCCAMYANPKSGNQGRIFVDGVNESWNLSPGHRRSRPEDPSAEVLRTFLYRDEAIAYCCAYAGLRLTDARPFTGVPDLWIQLPPRDYWSHESSSRTR